MPSPTTAVICLGSATAPNSGGDDVSCVHVSAKSKSELSTALQSSAVAASSLSSLTIIINSSELSAAYDSMALAGLVSSLRPGGTVQIRIDGDAPVDDLGPVNDSLLLAGLSAESERREGKARILTARKKDSAAEPASSRSAPIKLALGGGAGGIDDDDIIDEDDLLAEEGAPGGVLAPPPAVDAAARAAAAADDCGGRKACDNCTCGRAEREAMERAGQPDENRPTRQVPTSSCGNCAKGDAFRCASCPFLGKPAFKPGEEHLVLDLADDL